MLRICVLENGERRPPMPPPFRGRRSAAGGPAPPALDCWSGAAGCVGDAIPGALSILKGAVPGRARGLGHTAPTYVVGTRDRTLRRPARLRTFPLPGGFSGKSHDSPCAERIWQGGA